MSVTAYAGQPLAPGMLVCRRSIMTNGFSSRPLTIVRVSGSRAIVADRDSDERRIDLSTIEYVVDTMEEGMKMAEASADFLNAERVIEEAHLKARAERKRVALAEAIKRIGADHEAQ